MNYERAEKLIGTVSEKGRKVFCRWHMDTQGAYSDVQSARNRGYTPSDHRYHHPEYDYIAVRSASGSKGNAYYSLWARKEASCK